MPPGERGAGTQAPGAEEGSQKPDRRACVQLRGGGSFFGVGSGGWALNCVGRKWDPAVSRVGIGRTAALWGPGGWKAGACSGGVLNLSCEIRADYCICVAAAAHKMAAGRRRGREEAGGPPGWKGSLAALPPRRLTSLPRRAGRAPVLGPCFRKSRLPPLHRPRNEQQRFGEAVAAPSPSAPGLRERARPDCQSQWGGSTTEGVTVPLGLEERRRILS